MIFNSCYFLCVIDSYPGESNGEAAGSEPIRAAGAAGQPAEGGVYGSGVWRGEEADRTLALKIAAVSERWD